MFSYTARSVERRGVGRSICTWTRGHAYDQRRASSGRRSDGAVGVLATTPGADPPSSRQGGLAREPTRRGEAYRRRDVRRRRRRHQSLRSQRARSRRPYRRPRRNLRDGAPVIVLPPSAGRAETYAPLDVRSELFIFAIASTTSLEALANGLSAPISVSAFTFFPASARRTTSAAAR